MHACGRDGSNAPRPQAHAHFDLAHIYRFSRFSYPNYPFID